MTGRFFVSSIFVLLATLLAMPAASQESGEPTPSALPVAEGEAGATDQVEAWIKENLADVLEPASPRPDDQQTTAPASAFPTAPETAPETAHDAAPEAPLDGGAEPGGSLDWASGAMSYTAEEIIAPGAMSPVRARAIAVRRATLGARKALLSAVESLALDGRRTVKTALSGAELHAVQAHLQNSRIEKREVPVEDGSTRVLVTSLIKLRGTLGNLLMPSGEPFLGGVPDTVELTAANTPQPVRDEKQAAYRQSMADLGGFTGLVVDARGLDAKPALLPVVVDPSGLTAYGPFQVSRDDAVAHGLAIFTHDPNGSLLRSRAGKSPLTVRALAVSGANMADLIISYEDAILVRTLFKKQDVQNNCRAVIILD